MTFLSSLKPFVPRILGDAAARVVEGRSPKWGSFRDSIIRAHPFCACCGNADPGSLNAHHVWPFYFRPDLELDPANVIVLCERGSPFGINCHLVVGHLGNFKSYNPEVAKAAAFMFALVEVRRATLAEHAKPATP